jgi:hypothetical protein
VAGPGQRPARPRHRLHSPGTAIHDVFETSGGTCPVDQLSKDYTARRQGIPVDDQDGDLLPDVDDAITRTIAAIWFGITSGYLTLAGSHHIPRKYLR